MLPRTPEPEVMEAMSEAIAYDRMDHSGVNRVFVDDLLTAWDEFAPPSTPECESEQEGFIEVVDLGTGTAQIPIELCTQHSAIGVLAVDASANMLEVAMQNIDIAGFREQIRIACHDAGELSDLGTFDIVMSNSLVHHLHQPQRLFARLKSLASGKTLFFLRDLLRPQTSDEVEALVTQYAGEEEAEAQRMFRESLHAALTVDEVEELVVSAGFEAGNVKQTSDRHWTWVGRWPA